VSIVVGDAVAEEKGKEATRHVFYMTTSHILKVPDVEGHANTLLEEITMSFPTSL